MFLKQKKNTHIDVIIYSENPLAAIKLSSHSEIDNCPVVINKINTTDDANSQENSIIPIVQFFLEYTWVITTYQE